MLPNFVFYVPRWLSLTQRRSSKKPLDTYEKYLDVEKHISIFKHASIKYYDNIWD